MKIIGSQRRETLKESGYTLVSRPRPGVVLLRDESGKLELWYANDTHAGYTIQIGRWGYEFGTSNIPPQYYVPFPVGTVRGPYRTGPLTNSRIDYMVQGPNGWVPFSGNWKDASDTEKRAKDYAKLLTSA